MFRALIRTDLCVCLIGLCALTGCSGKAPLDAAGEQALREDMKRVAVEEQDNRRKNPGIAASPSSQPQMPNFHPEGED